MSEEDSHKDGMQSFNISDEKIIVKNKLPLKLKLLIASLIILTISLIIGVIILIIITQNEKNEKDKIQNEKNKIEEEKKKLEEEIKKKEEEDIKKKQEEAKNQKYELLYSSSGWREPWYTLYGNLTKNISYSENDKIYNSFKLNEINYKEEIGNVNNGKDYTKNERNIYDLYIPYSSLSKKDDYNGIMLFIHGGAWINNYKEEVEAFCSRYSKLGFITATVEYTLLSGEYEEYNIYRIIDEITACIKSIKKELKSQGFNEQKLELAIGGISAGAHLSLLYSYLNKNNIIPIKFIINMVAPITLEPDYWYFNADKNKTLEDITKREYIENAFNNGMLNKHEEFSLLYYMNIFLGNKYTNEELKAMMDNTTINIKNEKYQEMLKLAENGFPLKLIKNNNNLIPLLCIYAGDDELVGEGQYFPLKEIYDKSNEEIYLVYYRYGNHVLYHFGDEESINSMKEMHNKILDFAKRHFRKE